MNDLDALVREVLAGNRERYRAIVAACEPSARVVLAARLPDRSALDDLLHEVFITAYLKLGEYRMGEDLRAWVNGIARNLAMNERRRWIRQRRLHDRYRAEIEEVALSRMDGLADAADETLLDRVRACIDRLGDNARRVVQQYYIEGASGPEIARRGGRPESWVRLVLFRARAALTECLGHSRAVPHG